MHCRARRFRLDRLEPSTQAPKPRFALAIGVIGHSPDRLPQPWVEAGRILGDLVPNLAGERCAVLLLRLRASQQGSRHASHTARYTKLSRERVKDFWRD